MSTHSDDVLAYAMHWDGETCSDCEGTCVWNDDTAVLECRCSTREPISIWLGNTP